MEKQIKIDPVEQVLRDYYASVIVRQDTDFAGWAKKVREVIAPELRKARKWNMVEEYYKKWPDSLDTLTSVVLKALTAKEVGDEN